MNNFNQWNRIKIEIDSKDEIIQKYPKIGQVWAAYLGKNVGREQDGGGKDFSRPL